MGYYVNSSSLQYHEMYIVNNNIYLVYPTNNVITNIHILIYMLTLYVINNMYIILLIGNTYKIY